MAPRMEVYVGVGTIFYYLLMCTSILGSYEPSIIEILSV